MPTRPVMLLAVLAAFALVAAPPAAQTVLSGHVLSHDGSPLPLAHVQHVTPDGRAALETTRASPDGAFTLSLPASGVAAVRFLGPGHDPLTTVLALEDGTPVSVRVHLGLPESVNHEGGSSAGIRVGPDSTYALSWEDPSGPLAADVPATGDSALVAFTGLVQFTGAPFVPAGRRGYVFDGRTYALRLPVRAGRVEVVLDTTEFPDREVLGQITFADPDALVARYAQIHTVAAARKRARRAESYVRLLENIDPDALPYVRTRYAADLTLDWQADQARSLAALDTADHPALRQALLVAYLDAGGEDPVLMARALRDVPPDSPAWSMRPEALADAAQALGGEATYSATLDAALSHPDPRVAGRILIDRLSTARAEGRTDDARVLYDRLVTEAARTKYASYARQRLAPDLRIVTGALAPDFSLTPVGGGPAVSLDALPGRVTLLDFWATWCLPCVAEMENLHAVYDRYRSDGLEVVSISLDDDIADVEAFRAERWPMPWAHAFPEDGFDSSIARAFEINGLPTLVLLSRDGTILATDVDLVGDALDATVRRALSDSQ